MTIEKKGAHKKLIQMRRRLIKIETLFFYSVGVVFLFGRVFMGISKKLLSHQNYETETVNILE